MKAMVVAVFAAVSMTSRGIGQVRTEVTPFVGAYGATRNEIEETPAACSGTCFTLRQASAVVAGIRVETRLSSWSGIGAAIAFSPSAQKYAALGGFPPQWTGSVAGSVAMASVYLRFNLLRSSRLLYVAAGPALVLRQGYDSVPYYDSPRQYQYAPLDHQHELGVIVALGSQFRVDRVRLRVEASGYLSSVRFPSFPVGGLSEPPVTPTQRDFMVSIGVPLALGRRAEQVHERSGSAMN